MGLMSSFFERQLVGLDIGVSGIKAVEIAGKKTPRLVAYNRLPLPWETISSDGEIRQRETVIAALKKLFTIRAFTTKKVAVGASGNAIITKKISVPRMTAAELNHQLYWEAEQYIPFNINEVNLDFGGGEKGLCQFSDFPC
jgi:type IV pilus assembly protein PilM